MKPEVPGARLLRDQPATCKRDAVHLRSRYIDSFLPLGEIDGSRKRRQDDELCRCGDLVELKPRVPPGDGTFTRQLQPERCKLGTSVVPAPPQSAQKRRCLGTPARDSESKGGRVPSLERLG